MLSDCMRHFVPSSDEVHKRIDFEVVAIPVSSSQTLQSQQVLKLAIVRQSHPVGHILLHPRQLEDVALAFLREAHQLDSTIAERVLQKIEKGLP